MCKSILTKTRKLLLPTRNVREINRSNNSSAPVLSIVDTITAVIVFR